MIIVPKEGHNLTPRLIVEFLDRYIVGQDRAKKAVAIALRNRIRRRNLPQNLANEIAPKNILMVGPQVWAKRRSPEDWLILRKLLL